MFSRMQDFMAKNQTITMALDCFLLIVSDCFPAHGFENPLLCRPEYYVFNGKTIQHWYLVFIKLEYFLAQSHNHKMLIDSSLVWE